MIIGRRRLIETAITVATAPAIAAALSSYGAAMAGTRDTIRYLAAANKSRYSDRYSVSVMRLSGESLLSLPLPDRGHACVFHPSMPQMVCIARRPGTYLMVVDLSSRQPGTIIQSMSGRHFYGHGCFDRSGRLFYATENDFDTAAGLVGVYDVTAGYQRIHEFRTYGIGPHDIALQAETGHLVVANGGIQTHPDTGREKLNLETMRSSIVFVDPKDGRLVAKHETPDSLHQLSIRHFAFDENGNCYFGGQHQDSYVKDAPMAGIITFDGRMEFWAEPRSETVHNYVTSIAAVPGKKLVAISSARANGVFLVSTVTGTVIDMYSEFDVSGVGSNGASIITSSGEGSINQRMVNDDGELIHQDSMWNSDVHWDNHITLR